MYAGVDKSVAQAPRTPMSKKITCLCVLFKTKQNKKNIIVAWFSELVVTSIVSFLIPHQRKKKTLLLNDFSKQLSFFGQFI